ncbi:actin binding protein [Coemansia interrupta]|uniref:Actin binding protein n=1 Tax=Coemansia interrupta TaxID=1126814 RepID=A0A9W8H933_9FUNG|nr:actin binding protein [Coemansia interrupta]
MVNSLDLSAHAAEITSTHQRILANDSSISWAVYGFDRGGTTLNVQATGSEGLDELAEEFDDGKVQFAFARVQDPNTQLAKFVFISWCGQGVPVFRKGMVSSQVGEVQQVLGGSHVTVIARSAEDVLPDEIMDKVERSSGAQYSYHTQPKRQPPAPAAKPAFGTAGGQAFRKGATYGAPSVGKGAAWNAAAANPPPVASKPVAPKPAPSPATSGYSKPSYAASPAASLGGTKPLFSGAGRPVSSFFGGARSPTTPSAALSPGIHQQTARPSPPVSPAPEPARTAPAAPPPSAYRSQQDERQAELEALRRGSRGTSPSGVSRAETPTSSSSRLGAGTPAGEPSANFSQADQTKSELELLRSRRLLNTNLGASSGPSAARSEVDERKAELEALRRGRGGSQSSMGSQPAPPTHSWSQSQSQSQVSRKQEEENERMRQQQQEDEQRRRREQEENDRRRQQEEADRRRREQEEEEDRRRQQQQQRDEDERRRQQQQQQRDEEDRKRQQQQQQQQREREEREVEEERKRQLQQQESALAAAHSAPAATSSRGQRARAVYDYDAEAEDELPFKEGDIIYNVDQLDPGWWAGETEDGSRQGVFPSNFVELIEDEPAPRAVPAAPLPPRAVPAPPPMAPAPPPAAPAPPPMAPAPPPVAPPPPPVAPAPPAPNLPPVPPPVSWSPPAAPAPPPMAPPMPPALPPRGGISESEAAPALPPRGGPPPPPAPPAPPSAAPALPPRGAPAAPPPPPPPPPAAPQQQQDFGQNYAIAVYEYEAAEDGELSFREGERITHIEFPSSEWWEGVNEKGEYGLFPANYVELESH